jgi:hypothetical protein
LRAAKQLHGYERLRAGVQIHNHELRRRFKQLQQGIGIRSDFDFQAEMFCRLGKFHLKKQIIHVSNNAWHRWVSPCITQAIE